MQRNEARAQINPLNPFLLENGLVKVGVNAQGGYLDPVSFLTVRRQVSPMYRAPWLTEKLPEEIPPMLRGLRGDFFCAPFGESDLTPEESRSHGTTANGVWHNTRQSADTLEFVLEGKVLGAEVRKRVHLNPGEAVV